MGRPLGQRHHQRGHDQAGGNGVGAVRRCAGACRSGGTVWQGLVEAGTRGGGLSHASSIDRIEPDETYLPLAFRKMDERNSDRRKWYVFR
jgi:hypothetical protein